MQFFVRRKRIRLVELAEKERVALKMAEKVPRDIVGNRLSDLILDDVAKPRKDIVGPRLEAAQVIARDGIHVRKGDGQLARVAQLTIASNALPAAKCVIAFLALSTSAMQSTSSKRAIVCSGRSALTFALCESPSVSIRTRRGGLSAHFATKGPATRIPLTSQELSP